MTTLTVSNGPLTEIKLPFTTEPYRADQARSGERRWKPANVNRETAPETPRAIIKATPFVWVDPAAIPRRQWLYGHHYVRKFISETVAPAIRQVVAGDRRGPGDRHRPRLLGVIPDERIERLVLEWRRPDGGIAAADCRRRAALSNRPDGNRGPAFRRHRARDENHHRRADQDRARSSRARSSTPSLRRSRRTKSA